MNTYFRRILSIGVSLLALAPGLASNVTPAMAAGKVVVDDDKVQCPKATFTNIQAAVNSLGPNPTGKIIVCAGTYPGTITVLNANKLKLTAKKGVVITPSAPGFSGVLLNVITSTTVTVQGFTFDGQGNIGGAGVALQFSESSGKIQTNAIQNWHTPGYGTPGTNKAIYLTNGLGQTVKVVKNTLTDFQGTGIFAEGLSTLTITGNKVNAPSAGSVDVIYGIRLQPIGSGAPGGKITGNKLASDTFPGFGPSSLGIVLTDTGGVKISGNAIMHWGIGVTVQNACFYLPDANNVTISGNKIMEVFTGISIANFASNCDTHVDNLRVTGNKIVDTAMAGDNGIVLNCGSYLPGQATILNARVKGNKITQFNTPILDLRGPDCTVTGIIQ